MGRKNVSEKHTHTSGVSVAELLGVLAILTILAAIFFPVYQGINPLPNGAVQDGSGKPLPGAVLRFRDPSGRIVAAITSDDYGSFRQHGLSDLSKDTVDGFGLMRARRRTGAGSLYTFSPLGTHRATFRDASGNLIAGLAVSVGPDTHARQWPFHKPFESISDSKGTIQVTNTPIGGRFGFLSQDPNYVIGRVQTTVDGNTVRYSVLVTRSAL